MRLLHVQTFALHTYYGDDIPPYAIMSHTWLRENEEVTFASISSPSNSVPSSWRDIPGAQKIIYMCKQAANDGLDYAWIDTCCIDKTNSVELSEAINSMFRWYQRSKICYAYLVDVDKELGDLMEHSRWWDRAWTLQELVAPAVVQFYDQHWHCLGSKADLTSLISLRSGIDRDTLEQPDTMYVKSIAHRMSWAAHRKATRLEDQAYSLLGIFDVNLSMQYGEGSTAFRRLQEKILSKTNDQTLFAWGLAPCTIEQILSDLRTSKDFFTLPKTDLSTGAQDDNDDLPWHAEGIFADAPARFSNCGNLMFYTRHAFVSHIAELNGALKLELPLANLSRSLKASIDQIRSHREHRICIGLLPCGSLDKSGYMIGILLEEWTEGRFCRIELIPGVFTFLVDCHSINGTKRDAIWVDNLLWIMRHRYGPEEANTFHKSVRLELAFPPQDYSFEVQSMNWNFDKNRSVLERYHRMDPVDRHLKLALHRNLATDTILIAISLSNCGDGAPTAPKNRVCIIRKRKSDGTPWITNRDFNTKSVETAASFEEVHVAIKTHQVFNHLISTLSISCRPPLELDSIEPRSPTIYVEAESPYDLLELKRSLSESGKTTDYDKETMELASP